jgi:hypothetical protein
MHLQSLSSILSHVTLMNLGIRRKDLSTNNRATTAIGSVPIMGILLAAAAVLSGFSSVIGSETAIAQQQQQNLTGTNATTTATNATGNQTPTSNNQTGAAADTSGDSSNNAVTAGSYYP